MGWPPPITPGGQVAGVAPRGLQPPRAPCSGSCLLGHPFPSHQSRPPVSQGQQLLVTAPTGQGREPGNCHLETPQEGGGHPGQRSGSGPRGSGPSVLAGNGRPGCRRVWDPGHPGHPALPSRPSAGTQSWSGPLSVHVPEARPLFTTEQAPRRGQLQAVSRV